MMESLVVAVEGGVLAYVLDYLTAAGAGAASAVAEASFCVGFGFRVLGLVVGLGLGGGRFRLGAGHFRFRGNDSLGFFRAFTAVCASLASAFTTAFGPLPLWPVLRAAGVWAKAAVANRPAIRVALRLKRRFFMVQSSVVVCLVCLLVPG
jgi:hypothetical protein